MKTLSFGVIEILPSLLDKSKTQTIRPEKTEYKQAIRSQQVLTKMEDGRHRLDSFTPSMTIEKPPRFAVGEDVRLYWKQRSQYKWFCKKCGNALEEGYFFPNVCTNCEEGSFDEKKVGFHKILGEGKITEVFKITMVTDGNGAYKTTHTNNKENHINFYLNDKTSKFIRDLAKRDGFKSPKEMFETLNKMYDLISPRNFWVYRWKWNK